MDVKILCVVNWKEREEADNLGLDAPEEILEIQEGGITERGFQNIRHWRETDDGTPSISITYDDGDSIFVVLEEGLIRKLKSL